MNRIEAGTFCLCIGINETLFYGQPSQQQQQKQQKQQKQQRQEQLDKKQVKEMHLEEVHTNFLLFSLKPFP